MSISIRRSPPANARTSHSEDCRAIPSVPLQPRAVRVRAWRDYRPAFGIGGGRHGRQIAGPNANRPPSHAHLSATEWTAIQGYSADPVVQFPGNPPASRCEAIKPSS